MVYSKCFNVQTMLAWYGNFPRKQNLDFLEVMTCDNWVFKVGRKNKNLDFTGIFSFSDSNIFVELLVINIKLYIFWKKFLSSTQRNVK